MKINKIALAISIAAVSSLSQASMTGLNLNGAAHWYADSFTATGSGFPFGPGAGSYDLVEGQFTDMFSPSGNVGGGLYVDSFSGNSMAILTSGDGDPRLYSSSTGDFSFDVYGLAASAGFNSIQLQIKNRGTTSGDGGTPLFDGNAPASEVLSVVDGGANSVSTYVWDFSPGSWAPHSTKSITFSSFAPHKSYDAFAITANPVPVPAAAWLFGSALLGLAGLRKKK